MRILLDVSLGEFSVSKQTVAFNAPNHAIPARDSHTYVREIELGVE